MFRKVAKKSPKYGNFFFVKSSFLPNFVITIWISHGIQNHLKFQKLHFGLNHVISAVFLRMSKPKCSFLKISHKVFETMRYRTSIFKKVTFSLKKIHSPGGVRQGPLIETDFGGARARPGPMGPKKYKKL